MDGEHVGFPSVTVPKTGRSLGHGGSTNPIEQQGLGLGSAFGFVGLTIAGATEPTPCTNHDSFSCVARCCACIANRVAGTCTETEYFRRDLVHIAPRVVDSPGKLISHNWMHCPMTAFIAGPSGTTGAASAGGGDALASFRASVVDPTTADVGRSFHKRACVVRPAAVLRVRLRYVKIVHMVLAKGVPLQRQLLDPWVVLGQD